MVSCGTAAASPFVVATCHRRSVFAHAVYHTAQHLSVRRLCEASCRGAQEDDKRAREGARDNRNPNKESPEERVEPKMAWDTPLLTAAARTQRHARAQSLHCTPQQRPTGWTNAAVQARDGGESGGVAREDQREQGGHSVIPNPSFCSHPSRLSVPRSLGLSCQRRPLGDHHVRSSYIYCPDRPPCQCAFMQDTPPPLSLSLTAPAPSAPLISATSAQWRRA